MKEHKNQPNSMQGSFLLKVIFSVILGGITIFLIVKVVSLVTNYQEEKYQQIDKDMQAIAHAAQAYKEDYGLYPSDPRESGKEAISAPVDLVPKYLPSWPVPPCGGWHYQWANPNGDEPAVVVDTSTQPLYHLCVGSTDQGVCSQSAGGAPTSPITSAKDHKIDCTTIILK
jgi:hypothetical protein